METRRLEAIFPRFSVRMLLSLVTLIGVYFGCWELTKKRGLESENPTWWGAFDSSPAPFIICRNSEPSALKLPFVKITDGTQATSIMSEFVIEPTPRESPREYHVWFFGYTAKLFSRDVGALENGE